jgi:hypothetical protein
MKVSTPEQTLTLKKRLGWVDYQGREVGWERYVKPDGYYKDDDEEKPRNKNKKFVKKSSRTQSDSKSPRR